MITWKKHFLYLVDYQYWANENLFVSLDHLTDSVRRSQQDLYFGSLHHTLEQLLQSNRQWQARLHGQEVDMSARQAHVHDWRELRMCMLKECRQFQHWLESQPDVFYEVSLACTGIDGKVQEYWSRDILSHLFNHASLIRGQLSAVAMRLGAPPPQLDFLEYKREMHDCLDELALIGQPHEL